MANMWKGGFRRIVSITSFLLLWRCHCQVEAADSPVTYGSTITLRHSATKFQLFSTKISWGAGSGQQIVTSISNPDYNEDCLWSVKHSNEQAEEPPVAVLSSINSNDTGSVYNSSSKIAVAGPDTGVAVKCGDIIRLEHVETGKNLHGHHHNAALTPKNAEVTAYGNQGVGNSGDDFIVECTGKTKETQRLWEFGKHILLRHKELQNYLATSNKGRFSSSNCPRCPIIGHQEVSILRRKVSLDSDEIKWVADPVLVLENFDDDNDKDAQQSGYGHDEL